MKILQTQTLRGPNYWSTHHSKLILVRLDLEGLADRPSDTLPGFYDGIAAALPSLEKHICAPGCRGGFLSRVQEGTLVGHIFERVALELQTLADMSVGFGGTHETATPGIFQVVVEYQAEAAGRYATRAALRLCQSIIDTGTYPKTELRKDLDDLAELQNTAALGASTEALVREAENRGIPWTHLAACDLFQLGYGKYQKRIQAALTSHSGVLGVEVAGNKQRTKELLKTMGVPVPLGVVLYAFRDLEDAIHRLGGYPIVIKPLNGNQGQGITINVQSWRQAKIAYDRARNVSKGVIVEHFYQGRDHRILVVNHKVVAVAERVPAHVVGNGRSTIAQLVKQENQDDRRGEGHDNMLTHIELDDATDDVLSDQDFTLKTILPPGQICYLRTTANLSTGGIAIDRTDEIHPETVWLAERVSRMIDLDIAGIDVITTDITKTLTEADGVIVEVNAAPGLRMHIAPSQGIGRNVAAPILNMLFPPGTPHQIPIVAITGTNGRATPTPLIAHIFRQVYKEVGFTTTDGVYISDRPLKTGSTEKAHSASMILQDPTVEIAVLETAQDEVLQSGLAFQTCDVGVVLNVAADQLGYGDRNTINSMARVNAVIAETVHPNGYAVLNADDPQVVAMAQQVKGKVAYFSMDSENPVVRSHLQRGGIAAVYEKGRLSIFQEDWVHPMAQIVKIPNALGGGTPYLIANALAASLTAFVLGVKVEQIRSALHRFKASDWQTLGQQNPAQISLFNLDYYDCDQRKQYLDLKDEPRITQGALTLGQPPIVMHSSPLPHAPSITLEKALRHNSRTQETHEGHPLREKALAAAGSHSAAVLSEARPLEVPRLQTKPSEPAYRFHHKANAHEPSPLEQTAAQTRSKLVQKALTPSAKPKQKGFTLWVADRAIQLKHWVKKQAPILKQSVSKAVQKTAEQAFHLGEMGGIIAIAMGRVMADIALEKSKALGAIAWGKFTAATQLVDPATLDPALQDVIVLWGKNGQFINELFIFQQTPTGVDVYLKNGNPVYTDGKLNPHIDGRFSFALSQIPENIVEVKENLHSYPQGQV
jgi:cyanophycin synthetase